MTIKQQGGVFGRNPTFNDITADGSATISGPLVVNSSGADIDTQIGTVAGPYSFWMDGTNGAVGFGTNSVSPYFGTTIKLYNAGSGGTFQVGGSSITAGLWASQGLGIAALETVTAHDLLLSTNSTERVRIGATSGNVTVNNGNLVIGTSGKGIDFSATAGTGTSELFDDYEEGTWTPVLSFGNGTTGITYDVQSGNYVKIGNSVIVSCKIDLSSKGTDTGTAVIRGFPYTISSDGATGVIDPAAGFSGLVASGSTFMVIAGTTGYIMRQITSGREILTNANFLNSAILSFTLCYIAA